MSDYEDCEYENKHSPKELNLLKIASKHKYRVKTLENRVDKLESLLVSNLKINMDIDTLWDYAEEFSVIWKGDSSKVGCLTKIETYTNKKGQEFLAHFTINGKYISKVTEKDDKPKPYVGYFRVDKEYFYVKENSEAKRLVDFFYLKEEVKKEVKEEKKEVKKEKKEVKKEKKKKKEVKKIVITDSDDE